MVKRSVTYANEISFKFTASQKRRENGGEAVVEDSTSKIGTKSLTPIQEPQGIPSRINTNKITHLYFLITFLKGKAKKGYLNI